MLTKGSSPIQIVTEMIMNRVSYKFQHNFTQMQNSISTSLLLALDLIENMTKIAPELRPTIEKVIAHPYFWNEKDCLNFICKVARYLENPEEKSKLLREKLEIGAVNIIGSSWTTHIDNCILQDLSTWRKYKNTMFDLIRAIRNKVIDYYVFIMY